MNDPRAELLLHGGHTGLPPEIAICPECGANLYVYSHEWVDETGQPIATGLQVDCMLEYDTDNEYMHRFHQSDWQPVIDAIRKWCGAISDEETP